MLLLALMATLSPGCAPATTSNVAVGVITEGEEGQVLEKDYIIKDKGLARRIEILDVKTRFTGKFLEGLAMVHNRRKRTVDFEYRFAWYDEAGFPVESNVSHWSPDRLYGKESKWIRALCPKPGAAGFKIMIRGPHPIER
jgi:uncharacterized protein YcfL